MPYGAFSARKLLVGREEGHPVCRNAYANFLQWISVLKGEERAAILWPRFTEGGYRAHAHASPAKPELEENVPVECCIGLISRSTSGTGEWYSTKTFLVPLRLMRALHLTSASTNKHASLIQSAAITAQSSHKKKGWMLSVLLSSCLGLEAPRDHFWAVLV